jgi:predicted DNA binding CopG/RHH family protein
MVKADNFVANADDWDSRKLGQDEASVKRARKSHEESLAEALGLQMISIRFQKQLIEDLKFIATAHNIGYQPLIRDVLSRFVMGEKKAIMREAIERKRLELEQHQQEAELRVKGQKQRKTA